MFTKTKTDTLICNVTLIPNWQIFMFLALINFLVSFWSDRLIFTKELYYRLLSDQIELVRIDNLIELLKTYSLVSLIIIPIILSVKLLFSTLLLQLMLLLRYIEIKFSKLFRLIMFSSLILTSGQVAHFVQIYISSAENVTRKYLMVKPFALATFLETNAYPPSSLFVLNQCNVFEILWMGWIYHGLIQTGQIKKSEAALLSFNLWGVILFFHWLIYFFIEKLQ